MFRREGQAEPVVYACSDEPRDLLIAKLSDRGFTEDDPVELLPDWTILHLDLLEEALEAVKPSLLIIDSVRTAIAYPLGLDENNTGIGAYLKQVEALATRYGASVVFLHHDNKSKDSVGVCRSSGSTDIPGNVSVHWRLEAATKDPSDPNRVFTMPKTRGMAPQSLRLRLDLESYRWENLGTIGESEDAAKVNQSLAQQILELLNQRPSVGLEERNQRSPWWQSWRLHRPNPAC
uniref:AAA family ATPase n=1 Tax=Desertifilum tharense IPPAS B-1220 TaxID=1781255 RepID=A0ACD5H2Y9_9CYAN